jgi:hypothetical protein
MMTEDYWKKPEPKNDAVITDSGLGLWSRSRLFRCIAWIVTILVVIFLALLASAYLSGFDSIPEMANWLRTSLPTL